MTEWAPPWTGCQCIRRKTQRNRQLCLRTEETRVPGGNPHGQEDFTRTERARAACRSELSCCDATALTQAREKQCFANPLNKHKPRERHDGMTQRQCGTQTPVPKTSKPAKLSNIVTSECAQFVLWYYTIPGWAAQLNTPAHISTKPFVMLNRKRINDLHIKAANRKNTHLRNTTPRLCPRSNEQASNRNNDRQQFAAFLYSDIKRVWFNEAAGPQLCWTPCFCLSSASGWIFWTSN